MKIIKTLKNRGISLKGTTTKVKNQKGGFLGPLIRVGLSLIENVLKLLGKNALLPLDVTAAL